MDDHNAPDAPDAQFKGHHCTLTENHTVVAVFGADVPAKEIGRQYQATIDAQREIAERWAQAHGVEITVTSEHVPAPDGTVTIATTWTVTVGRAEVDADQNPPGALDRWRWSARVGFWRNLTAGLGREGRRLAVREDGLATVTKLRADMGRGFGIGMSAADSDLMRVPEGQDLTRVPPTPQMPHPEGGGITGPTFSLDSVPALLSPGYTVGFGEVQVHRPVPTTLDEQEQALQTGYLPGTGPAEHRPAWLQNDSVAGDVGGDWSNT